MRARAPRAKRSASRRRSLCERQIFIIIIALGNFVCDDFLHVIVINYLFFKNTAHRDVRDDRRQAKKKHQDKHKINFFDVEKIDDNDKYIASQLATVRRRRRDPRCKSNKDNKQNRAKKTHARTHVRSKSRRTRRQSRNINKQNETKTQQKQR